MFDPNTIYRVRIAKSVKHGLANLRPTDEHRLTGAVMAEIAAAQNCAVEELFTLIVA
jgi:hypothetical protein